MTGRLLIARLHRLCCAAVTNRLYFHISAPKMTKRIINTGDAPAAIGPYSQGVMVANTLYLSGQIGLDPKTGGFVSDDVSAQADQCLKNLGAVLKAAGGSYSDVVKATVLLKDIDDFTLVNDVYGKYFTSEEPARAAFQAAALPKDAKVEIEAVAYISSSDSSSSKQ